MGCLYEAHIFFFFDSEVSAANCIDLFLRRGNSSAHIQGVGQNPRPRNGQLSVQMVRKCEEKQVFLRQGLVQSSLTLIS